MQYQFESLRDSILIAMPSQNTTYFTQAVILLCEHDETGAMGVIINRPTDITVADLLLKMRIKNNNKDLEEIPVLSGGPVQNNKILLLHYNDNNIDPLEIPENINHEWELASINKNLSITGCIDTIKALANGETPEPYIVTLGYCEWDAGQLEREIVNNLWLTTPTDLDIIFNTPFEHQWRECTYNIGIDELHNLSRYSGHA